MEKEGKTNFKFIFSSLILTMLMVFVASAVTINLITPKEGEINTTNTREVNFTFNVTWQNSNENVTNCSLYTNYTLGFEGVWRNITDNVTAGGNISNNTVSVINYTFQQDIRLLTWDISCGASTLNTTETFSGENRTLTVDTVPPEIVPTEDFFNILNTSNLSLATLTFNLTDINGSGFNLSTTAGQSDNVSLNVTIYNFNDGVESDAIIGNLTLANTSILTCTPTGGSVESTQCTIAQSSLPLSNGTKNITINVQDRSNNDSDTTNLSFLFIVDQIPPVFDYYNFTNSSKVNTTADYTNA
jgi:hypothetical protein